jgi:hypothetical protein
MSLAVDHGTYGVKRQSTRKGNPRNFICNLLERNPRISNEDLREKVKAAALKNEDYLDAIVEYWVAGERRNLTSPPRTAAAKAPEQKAAVAAKVSEWKEQAVRRITLGVLDMVVDGKAIRDYTFGEIGKLGGKFVALSKGGKPNEKVGKLSEAAVRKLFR